MHDLRIPVSWIEPFPFKKSIRNDQITLSYASNKVNIECKLILPGKNAVRRGISQECCCPRNQLLLGRIASQVKQKNMRLRFILSSNHKDIGTIYLILAVLCGIIGTSLSTLIRVELSLPSNQIFCGWKLASFEGEKVRSCW